MNNPKLDPGSETLEARLFTVDEIPWSELAFKTVGKTLSFIEKNRYNKNHVHTNLFSLGKIMKSSSSIPWIEQEFENSIFDFDELQLLARKSPLQLVVL